MISRRALLALAGAAVGAAGGACTPHSMMPVESARTSPHAVDEDPLALLLADPIVFFRVDLQQLFQTPLGADVGVLVQSLVPLGADANFSATRDATRMYGGVYALQGLDFGAVIQGRFDVAAMRRAADARSAVPTENQLVRTTYGDIDVYTVANLGFCPVTAGTMLVGDEAAMRRMIDRIRYGRLRRDVPPWMLAVAETSDTGFGIAGDFGAESMFTRPKGAPPARPPNSLATPILQATAARFPFFADLRCLRVIGNFASPGLNVAGALTYATPERAAGGAEGLKSAADLAKWATMFSGVSLPPLQVRVNGNDAGFVQSIDAATVRSIVQLVKSVG